MRKGWYFLRKGHLEGPVSTQEVIGALRQGRTGPMDMVFREGGVAWAPVCDFSEFATEVEGLKFRKHGDVWMVLKRKGELRGQKLGPWTEADLQQKILSGEVTSSDYLWRSGMREWYPLAAVQKMLKQKEKSVRAEREDLLRSVQELRPTQSSDRSDLPNRDLPPSPSSGGKNRRDAREFNDRQNEVGKAPVTPSRFENPYAKSSTEGLRRRVSQFDWVQFRLDRLKRRAVRNIRRLKVKTLLTLMGAFGVLALAGIGIHYLWKEKTLLPSISKAPSNQNRPPAQNRQEPKPLITEPDPPAPKKAKISPSYLRLKWDAQKGRVRVLTNASDHYLTHLEFKSRLAAVVGAPSFYKRISVKDRDIDLKNWNWPRGYYWVEARIESFRDSEEVFVGEPSGFQKALRLHKKSSTLAFMNERVTLIKGVQRLQGLADQLERVFQGRMSRKTWIKKVEQASPALLRQYRTQRQNLYLLPEQWDGLRSLRTRLIGLSGQGGRREHLSQLQVIKGQLDKLHSEVQETSLWR